MSAPSRNVLFKVDTLDGRSPFPLCQLSRTVLARQGLAFAAQQARALDRSAPF